MSEQDESLSKRFKSNDNPAECNRSSGESSPTSQRIAKEPAATTTTSAAMTETFHHDKDDCYFCENENEPRKTTSTDSLHSEDLVATFQYDISDTEAGPSNKSSTSSIPQISPASASAQKLPTTTTSELIAATVPKRKLTVRNYRLRSATAAELDSDDDSDNDDVVNTEINVPSSVADIVAEIEDNALHSTEDSSVSSSSSTSAESAGSMPIPWSDLLNVNESDSSADVEPVSKSELQDIKKSIFQKEKPKYTWTALREMYYRQNGLTGKGRNSTNGLDTNEFTDRVCGSLQAVERLKLMHKLEKHNGCVNCLNFHKNGNLLVTGSDDLKIIIWKWATKQIAHHWESGHNSNVFQTKFVDFLGSGLDVVSSARDGFIRHHMISQSGTGSIQSFSISRHVTPVHKLALVPNNPYEILSASEDGIVIRCDLRERKSDRLATVKTKNRRVSLYSINHHPLDAEFCVCGRDSFIRVYDKRNTKNPLKMICANIPTKRKATHITCAVYNYTGTEILASCNDDIVLFDNTAQPDEYLLANASGPFLHKYSGHRNNSTIKGVNFFGPRSEFIMSGSDCGSCFFWEKKSEAIVQWVHADKSGAVNCLESHPSFPIVATSGLDYDIKIWAPMKVDQEHPFDWVGLEKCVTRNLCQRNESIGDLFDSQLLGFYVRQCLRRRVRRDFTTHLLLYSSEEENSMNAEETRSSTPRRRPDTVGAAPTVPSAAAAAGGGDADAANNDDGDDLDPGSLDQRFGSLPCSPS